MLLNSFNIWTVSKRELVVLLNLSSNILIKALFLKCRVKVINIFEFSHCEFNKLINPHDFKHYFTSSSVCVFGVHETISLSHTVCPSSKDTMRSLSSVRVLTFANHTYRCLSPCCLQVWKVAYNQFGARMDTDVRRVRYPRGFFFYLCHFCLPYLSS